MILIEPVLDGATVKSGIDARFHGRSSIKKWCTCYYIIFRGEYQVEFVNDLCAGEKKRRCY
jgi:hypothetical protein